jgi:hypothetical protein
MAERRVSTISWAGCRVSCRWQAVSNQLCGDSHAFGANSSCPRALCFRRGPVARREPTGEVLLVNTDTRQTASTGTDSVPMKIDFVS